MHTDGVVNERKDLRWFGTHGRGARATVVGLWLGLSLGLIACSKGGADELPKDGGFVVDAGRPDGLRGGPDGGDGGLSLPTVCTPSGGTPAVAQLAPGRESSCALYPNGQVACWGSGFDGALGDGKVAHGSCGAYDCAVTPVRVQGLADAVQLSVGGDFACALRASGRVSCWGLAVLGSLGDGVDKHETGCSADCARTPTTVAGLTDAVQVSAGSRGTACAVRKSGEVVCWGNNDYGQLGDGTRPHGTCTQGTVNYDCARMPVAVAQINDAVEVGVGHTHACARKRDGRILCWGDGQFGQIGDGARSARPLPTAVTGITDAAALTVGYEFACVLREGGEVMCWGYGNNGQLGDGQTVHTACTAAVDCSLLPVTVKGLTDARRLSARWTHACASKSDQTLVCWGDNAYGELGDGKPTHTSCRGSDCSREPVPVLGLTGTVAIAAHTAFGCALRSDCNAVCWGMNLKGQLGDGTSTNQSLPVPVRGL